MRSYFNEAENDYSTYHYVLNAQGDVIKLMHGSNKTVAEYSYDAWGNVLRISGAELGNLSVAELNPLRYRGYYCDGETGFYYLQSRYYDPIVRRFLNGDSFASTGQGILGYNMFAYCNNNPVISTDSTGHSCVALDPVLGGGGGKKEPEVKVPTCTNSSGTTHGGNSGSSGASHPNDATICYMFGVDSVEQVPGYEPGCMFFAENTYAVSVSKVVSIVHGKTVVMDRDKYCIYVFAGVSPGISYRGCPGDATITQGVVYGVSTPSDYSGIFVGATDNMVAMGAFGAIAPNGVSAGAHSARLFRPIYWCLSNILRWKLRMDIWSSSCLPN